MGHIQRAHLSNAFTVVPTGSLLRAMDRIMGPLFNLTLVNNVNNRSLADIRDMLLPELISGEIQVRTQDFAGLSALSA